jgi:transglutaminase-like putative cysteine protease
MFFAGAPVNASGVVRSIPDGRAGTDATLRLMRAAVRRGRVDPEIRSTALHLTLLQPERDCYAEIGTLFAWVRDNIRYVGDVLGVETLAEARQTLRARAGDCDDQCVLLASLIESIGYATRFIVAAYTQGDLYEHVFLGVDCGDGALLALDPTEAQGVGWEPPEPLIRKIEGDQ